MVEFKKIKWLVIITNETVRYRNLRSKVSIGVRTFFVIKN